MRAASRKAAEELARRLGEAVDAINALLGATSVAQRDVDLRLSGIVAEWQRAVYAESGDRLRAVRDDLAAHAERIAPRVAAIPRPPVNGRGRPVRWRELPKEEWPAGAAELRDALDVWVRYDGAWMERTDDRRSYWIRGQWTLYTSDGTRLSAYTYNGNAKTRAPRVWADRQLADADAILAAHRRASERAAGHGLVGR